MKRLREDMLTVSSTLKWTEMRWESIRHTTICLSDDIDDMIKGEIEPDLEFIRERVQEINNQLTKLFG